MIEEIRKQSRLGKPLGDADFLKTLSERLGSTLSLGPKGRPRKMGIVEEEADETIYWKELLILPGLVRKSDITTLLDEANQILAMTVSSIKTAGLRKK
jgi:four helix bundle protein